MQDDERSYMLGYPRASSLASRCRNLFFLDSSALMKFKDENRIKQRKKTIVVAEDLISSRPWFLSKSHLTTSDTRTKNSKKGEKKSKTDRPVTLTEPYPLREDFAC